MELNTKKTNATDKDTKILLRCIKRSIHSKQYMLHRSKRIRECKAKRQRYFQYSGGRYADALFFSLDHALEVHQESQEIQDDAWDCTLIKTMKENNDVIVTPIYYWLDSDIWEYIKNEQITTNPLYLCGYERVGCIGCPLATYKHILREFKDYPKYRQAYIKAFERMLEVRKSTGKMNNGTGYHNWVDGEAVFEWWIETYKRQVKGQIGLFDGDE